MMKLAPKMSSTQPLPCNDDDRSSLRHRFVRLNPRFDRDETLTLLKVSNKCTMYCCVILQQLLMDIVYTLLIYQHTNLYSLL